MPLIKNIPVIDERLYTPEQRNNIQAMINHHYQPFNARNTQPLHPIIITMLCEGFAFVTNDNLKRETDLITSLAQEYGFIMRPTMEPKDIWIYSAQKPPGNYPNFRILQPAMSLSEPNSSGPYDVSVYARFALPGQTPTTLDKYILEAVQQGFRVDIEELIDTHAGTDVYIPPTMIESILDDETPPYNTRAAIAERVGWDTEATILWKKEMQQAVTEQSWALAGQAAEHAGLPEETTTFYTRAMEQSLHQLDFTEAAIYAEKAGLQEKAAAYRIAAKKF
ncbi:MAG: hypothetical protein Q7R96_03180 [Nanoarchaeota archaeon]|nr:hypothetical protein [Nanoarchaeota archaeon]